MNELQRTLISNGVGAPPAHVLEGIDNAMAQPEIFGCPSFDLRGDMASGFLARPFARLDSGQIDALSRACVGRISSVDSRAMVDGAGAVFTRGTTSCGHRRRRGAARSLGRVPVARAGPAAHHDGARADRRRRGAQRLPSGPGGAAASAFRGMAAAFGRRYLVSNCLVWQKVTD